MTLKGTQGISSLRLDDRNDVIFWRSLVIIFSFTVTDEETEQEHRVEPYPDQPGLNLIELYYLRH